MNTHTSSSSSGDGSGSVWDKRKGTWEENDVTSIAELARRQEARRRRRGSGRLSPSISPVRQKYDKNNVRNLSEIVRIGQKYRGDLITKIECETPIPLQNGQAKMKKMYTLENGIIMVETKIKDTSQLMEEYNTYPSSSSLSSPQTTTAAESNLGNFLASSRGGAAAGANRRGSMQSQGSAWDNASVQSRQSMEDDARVERERRKALRRGRRNRTRVAPQRTASGASTMSRSTRSDYTDGTLSSREGSLDEFLTNTDNNDNTSSSNINTQKQRSPPPPTTTTKTQIESTILSSDMAFIDIIIEPIGQVSNSYFTLKTENETLDEGDTLCAIIIHTLYYHEDAIFRVESRSFAANYGRSTWGQSSQASIVGSTLKVNIEDKTTGTKDSVMYYLQDLATKSAHARQALMDG